MATVNSKYTVKKGDCAWEIAKNNLKTQNKNITDNAIIKEMQRLANINGCDNVDDFNTKYFSKIGNEISLSDTETSTNTSTSTNKKPVKVNPTTQLTPKEQEIIKINNLPNDLTRIIQYNKKNYKGEYYGVVNKKNCQLTIYDKSGKIIKIFNVGIGKTKSDGLNNYYIDHYYHTKDEYLAELNRNTTPGEFTLDEKKGNPNVPGYMGTDGKYRVMGLKGDNRGVHSGQESIHVVHNNDRKRIKGIKSPETDDNRMSYGCVNLLQEDYDAMHELLGEGDKIYILPEEKGNKLQLEKQPDGTYIFHQIYHKEDRREMSIAKASQVNYDVRPEKNTKKIAKTKNQSNTSATAQQQKKKENFKWYNPMTWSFA